MSVGLKLFCTECKTAIYIGTWNTYSVEEPDKVGKFLWKHRNHCMLPLDESTPYYEEWQEDDLLEKD